MIPEPSGHAPRSRLPVRLRQMQPTDRYGAAAEDLARDSGPRLRSERLLLRRWRSEDLPPFAAMNADPIVMEYYPSTLSNAESAALIERIDAGFDTHGFGPWAVEVPGEVAFIGYIGLSPVDQY